MTQSSDASAADAAAEYTRVIEEAVEHFTARRWRPAQEAFGRAHALQPSARTYRGIGLAAFYLGELVEARAAFEQALVDPRKPLEEEQRREVLNLLRRCVRETGRVELLVAPSTARVELDGAETEQRVLFLGRGEHVIAVTAEGHVPARRTLLIAGGEERSVALELQRVEPVATAPVAPVKSEPAPVLAQPSTHRPAAERDGRVYTWVAAAAAPVFAGTAAALWLTGNAKRDDIASDCEREDCDQAEADRRLDDAGLDSYETWTEVSLVAAAVSLGAAAVLFFVEGHQAEPAYSIGPGAALQGRF